MQGKKIIVAITGSIAAYKTPQLVRLLVKAGAEVQVIMTEAAKDFVSPLVLATVSKKAVFSSVSEESHWNNHVHLGRWADVMLVAPCSAHTIARMAHGICDNMVQAVYLSAACPVIIAPAMDEDMWLHPSTKANLEIIRSYGNHIIPVGDGELASGLFGPGRMAEPEEIAAYLASFLEGAGKTISVAGTSFDKRVEGKTALITAGPTYELIDPVRFIGNFSSGKMGVALAKALAEKGMKVHLVAGPGTPEVKDERIITHKVMGAEEMYEQCKVLFKETSIAIMAAAVADFRPREKADQKIKKGTSESFTIELVKNPDILASLGAVKREDQLLIGFALETNDELANARKKLLAKNADFIALNSLRDAGAGFEHDTNKVTLLGKDGEVWPLPLQTKDGTARQIIEQVLASKYKNA